MIDKIYDRAVSGELDPLLAYAQAKTLLATFEKQVKDLEELCNEEIDKYPKTFELDGFQFEKRLGRTMYDFKHISQWKDLDNAKKDLENDLKNALKLNGKIQMADADGIELELPKVSYTKDSLIIKKKQ